MDGISGMESLQWSTVSVQQIKYNSRKRVEKSKVASQCHYNIMKGKATYKGPRVARNSLNWTSNKCVFRLGFATTLVPQKYI